MTQDHMQAAVVSEPGSTPRYEAFPVPEESEQAVVVRITAAALKPSDRLAASGVHYGPSVLPFVAGLDGVGTLADGTRVAFFLPEQPFGSMAEQTLVARGRWLPVPDGADDPLAAALLNPGLAAWKTIVWEGEVAPGDRVLVLGATGAAGRIAAQLAMAEGADVVVAGRDRAALDGLAARGAGASIELDAPREAVVRRLLDDGPYDLVADFLWGSPAEALFEAFALAAQPAATRYILVGMAAGERASIPALALRRTPVRLAGSGSGRPLSLDESGAAYARLLAGAAAGEIELLVDTVPLRDVSSVWESAGPRRTVFVP